MTLDENIGQMTQANHRALIAESDIAEYALGSLLAGGGGSPATGNTAQDWVDMVDGYKVFEQPFFMLLNAAVVGTLGGLVFPDTEFPARMVVDYVRLYEHDPA